ncbi:hypothetical protein [Streptomyces sp. IBSBF 2394]|uniref:hypothetical protein n=1 Tax=Streptomyces sp. IBSBF 2394 TaxID=2903532 RepID=UPI002FDC18B6
MRIRPQQEDVAKFASDLTGGTVERIVPDDEQWVADQLTAGVPEETARLMLTWYHAARAGHFADAGPLLADLLGREPRTVADRLAAGLTA